MQGFNMGRYVPPDLEGTTSANKIHKKRAPGTLRKDGSQTVRFEMPFAVWCHTCNPHAIIGQGVRFNAEKKKVGYYYSTPIWQFRMKHAACGGWIEIRTDPKNTAYIVMEGGKARDYGDPADKIKVGENGQLILTPEERERRKEDAFSQLEGRVDEKQQGKENQQRIAELYQASQKDWKDTWSANRRLREGFRKDRKRIKREEDEKERLKERLGTDIDILPATEEDSKRAELISFGEVQDEDASSRAVFRPRDTSLAKPRSTKPKANRADLLRRQLLSNTRATVNPFGAPKAHHAIQRSPPLRRQLSPPPLTSVQVLRELQRYGVHCSAPKPSNESDDEYARRKDRKYTLSADELKNLKAQRDKVKEWLDGARCYGEYRRWKPRYEELKDQVKFAEKNVDEERKAVLRRYRL